MRESILRTFVILGLNLVLSVDNSEVIPLRRTRRQYSTGIKTDLFVDIVARTGYSVEAHNVTTEDGYILEVHRIPGGPLSAVTPGKPAVIFMHGIFATSEVWVTRGPGKDLAFMLADEGYDVWFHNVRGNIYCRKHVELSPRQTKFWKYSWHEHGIYDLAATIDYILATTGLTKVAIIATSLGATEIFVLMSSRPEYNEKVNIAVTLAPVGIFTDGLQGLLSIWVQYGDRLEDGLKSSGIYEFLPYSFINSQVASMCSRQELRTFCTLLFFQLFGYSDAEEFYISYTPELMKHVPAGTSVDTIGHLRQIIRSGEFRQRDFGSMENLNRYNSKVPPEYPMKKITVPITVYYGLNDPFATPSNVHALEKKLPNVIRSKEISHRRFNHYDFLVANESKTLIFDELLEDLQKYNE